MKISEIFESIIGEGEYMGYPALFIRLWGCNLKCEKCDTPHARQPNEYEELPPSKILLKIVFYHQKPTSYVVFTGGEPCLQIKEIEDVVTIVNSLEQLSVQFLIETNGTIFRKTLPKYFSHITISPKKGNNRHFKKWVSLASQNTNKVIFKFVVGNLDWTFTSTDLEKIIPDLLNEVRAGQIWLMPFGRTHEELQHFSKLTWELATKYKVCYSDRLHIRVWGNERGR
jgi:organic radical activating enzyme